MCAEFRFKNNERIQCYFVFVPHGSNPGSDSDSDPCVVAAKFQATFSVPPAAHHELEPSLAIFQEPACSKRFRTEKLILLFLLHKLARAVS